MDALSANTKITPPIPLKRNSSCYPHTQLPCGRDELFDNPRRSMQILWLVLPISYTGTFRPIGYLFSVLCLGHFTVLCLRQIFYSSLMMTAKFLWSNLPPPPPPRFLLASQFPWFLKDFERDLLLLPLSVGGWYQQLWKKVVSHFFIMISFLYIYICFEYKILNRSYS